MPHVANFRLSLYKNLLSLLLFCGPVAPSVVFRDNFSCRSYDGLQGIKKASVGLITLAVHAQMWAILNQAVSVEVTHAVQSMPFDHSRQQWQWLYIWKSVCNDFLHFRCHPWMGKLDCLAFQQNSSQPPHCFIPSNPFFCVCVCLVEIQQFSIYWIRNVACKCRQVPGFCIPHIIVFPGFCSATA